MIYLTLLCAFIGQAGTRYAEYPMTYKDAVTFSKQAGTSIKSPLFKARVCRMLDGGK